MPWYNAASQAGSSAGASGMRLRREESWWRSGGAVHADGAVDADSTPGLRARGRRRDVVAEAGGVGADPARRGMAEVDVDVEKEGGVTDAELAKQRDYLNGLVAESASKTREQACNVAFAKTHKTASTTLAMILVRYARRHDKKLASFGGPHVSAIPLGEAVEQVRKSGERVDVMHYHYTESGMFTGRWKEATAMYKEIMQEGERISYVTVVRNHREHFLSYYYYFVQPEVQLSVEHFFQRDGQGMQNQRERLKNPLCLEFGIHTSEELDEFIQAQLPDFRLIILTEAFDEGLMVLRRLMGWEMIDMTYARMMETKAGSRRWDGKDLKNVPHFDDLSQERKAVAAIEIEAELKEFEELQVLMNGYLHGNTSSGAAKW
eukprot:jgi/Undpi1/2810/HiC_scaffold_14.g06187.m1